ncbi:MAG: hypothetical protein IPP47_33055 [Bryobacterales bacterium]|nr:hypothetical protein [Bryobacterales bacterium]
MPISVVASGGDAQSSVSATLTSLDPDKLRISSDGAATGEASITASPERKSACKPWQRRARRHGACPLKAPGYATAEREVQFVTAELQMMNPAPSLSLRPLVSSSVGLLYGPLDERGLVSSQFGGSLRPGIRSSVRISSSDSNVLGIPQSEMTLATYMNIPLLPVAPGRARIQIDAPSQINNRVATIDAVVGPFQFNYFSVSGLVRYLVSKLTVTNPRPQPTAVTVSSDGRIPLRFGTAASGADGPSGSSLLANLSANESLDAHVEPAGSGIATIRLDAPDFASASSGTYVSYPQVRLDQGSPAEREPVEPYIEVAVILVVPTAALSACRWGPPLAP